MKIIVSIKQKQKMGNLTKNIIKVTSNFSRKHILCNCQPLLWRKWPENKKFPNNAISKHIYFSVGN